MVPRLYLLLAFLTAGQASAATIIVVGADSASGVSGLWIDENGAATQASWVGGIDITAAGYNRMVYCADLFTNISVGTYNTVLDFSDPATYQRVAWLMQYEWPSAIYTGSTLQTEGAGFQLAIWDILTDVGDGFGTTTTAAGRVSQSTNSSYATDSAVLAAALKYETDSLGKTSTSFGVVYHNTDSNNNTVQTLMGTTPEPATLAMIFGGLALIAVGRFRRRATHR